MRVITGTARGVPLKAPKGMDTRPTMDQVKEGIFSAIQFEIEGRTGARPVRRLWPAWYRGA